MTENGMQSSYFVLGFIAACSYVVAFMMGYYFGGQGKEPGGR